MYPSGGGDENVESAALGILILWTTWCVCVVGVCEGCSGYPYPVDHLVCVCGCGCVCEGCSKRMDGNAFICLVFTSLSFCKYLTSLYTMCGHSYYNC